MSLELIAVVGCTFLPDLSNASCSVAVVPVVGVTQSAKTSAEGAFAYMNALQITVTNITWSTATIPDPGPYDVTMVATALKTSTEGFKVLRQGDLSEQIDAVPQTPNPGGDPIDTPISFKIEVTAAGQLTVKGA